MNTYTLCSTGCGARSDGFLMCHRCTMKDPYELRRRSRTERVLALRRQAAEGKITKKSCVRCIHWAGSDCSLEIPECGPTFARMCSCYRKSP
jgi:hypothetical protein